jgi:exosortase/archaeosortase family protein
MRRFIASYLLFLMLLSAFFVPSVSSFANQVNGWQTARTLEILATLLPHTMMQESDIWVEQGYKIVINDACNGLLPLWLLVASLLAYPSTVRHTLLWLMVGYFGLLGVNIVRILWVVSMTAIAGEEWFYWSHDLVGNALLMVGGLVIFVASIRSS